MGRGQEGFSRREEREGALSTQKRFVYDNLFRKLMRGVTGKSRMRA
jgi:hypothetical protein